MVFFQMTHSCQSNLLNCCTLDIFCALHIVLLVRQTTVCIYICLGCFFQWNIVLMFLFKSNVYRPSGTSLLKVLFSEFDRRELIFAAFYYFCGFFILRELIFADRGQSAKCAKIRTRNIFMLHGKIVLSPSIHSPQGGSRL